MLKKLLLLSFIEGAVVMVAELCGAKLLAPIFGSSLYVWASVMGVTLAALALGYFFGGNLSVKAEPSKKLFLILSFAALFTMLMPVIAHYLVPRVSYLSFLPAIVISTVILLLLPVFLLGASSPLFIVIQTKLNDGGRVSGTVYAVSTFGGIVATFLCGFYLIPHIGLTACLLAFGGLLFVCNLLVFKIYKAMHLFLFVGFMYLNVQVAMSAAGQRSTSDSILGKLEVIDVINENKDSVRILKINSIVQTEMNLDSKLSMSDYVRLLDTLIPTSATKKSSLVLGLGGGLTANLLIHKNYNCTGVELDQRIIQSAVHDFYLNPNVKTVYEDARYFLNKDKGIYDLILVDIFKAEEQPSHVLTMESLEVLKKNLSDSALLFINWHGYLKGNKGLGTLVLYNTLKKSGFNVKLCSLSDDENYRNIMFVASLMPQGQFPYELINERVEDCSQVNTDDFPLLEKYNAQANKAWRSNYLRYYQNAKN